METRGGTPKVDLGRQFIGKTVCAFSLPIHEKPLGHPEVHSPKHDTP